MEINNNIIKLLRSSVSEDVVLGLEMIIHLIKNNYTRVCFETVRTEIILGYFSILIPHSRSDNNWDREILKITDELLDIKNEGFIFCIHWDVISLKQFQEYFIIKLIKLQI